MHNSGGSKMLFDYVLLCKNVYICQQVDLGAVLLIKAIKTWIKLKLLLLAVDQYHFRIYTFCEDTEIIGNKVL